MAVATFIITVTTRTITNADVAVDLQDTFVNVTWRCYSFHKTETIHGCKSFTLHSTNLYFSHNNRWGTRGKVISWNEAQNLFYAIIMAKILNN